MDNATLLVQLVPTWILQTSTVSFATRFVRLASVERQIVLHAKVPISITTVASQIALLTTIISTIHARSVMIAFLAVLSP